MISRVLRKQDAIVLLLTICLTLLGLFAIYDSGYVRSLSKSEGVIPREFRSQLISLAIAVIAGFCASLIPVLNYKKASKWIIGGTLFFSALTLVPGLRLIQNGACRWIKLGPIQLQPSEFAKVGVILFLAAVLADRKPWVEPSKKFRDWADRADRVWVPKLVRAFPLVLILVLAFKIEREPDLGTAAVILSIMMILFWLGGVSSKSMKILVVFGMIATVGLMVLEPYRLDRITNHYHRWDEKNVDDIGFQTTQSETAMAGGGLAGVGIGAGRAKHIIPAPTTDFVMATIGEEFGLIGSLITILVMGALVFRLIYLSRTVHSETAKLILLGVAAWLGVQSCVNVIMANGTAPAIGIPFPFISSGGSSLIALWIAMGVCQACVINAPVKEKVRENSRNRRRYRGSRLSGARSR